MEKKLVDRILDLAGQKPLEERVMSQELMNRGGYDGPQGKSIPIHISNPLVDYAELYLGLDDKIYFNFNTGYRLALEHDYGLEVIATLDVSTEYDRKKREIINMDVSPRIKYFTVVGGAGGRFSEVEKDDPILTKENRKKAVLWAKSRTLEFIDSVNAPTETDIIEEIEEKLAEIGIDHDEASDLVF